MRLLSKTQNSVQKFVQKLLPVIVQKLARKQIVPALHQVSSSGFAGHFYIVSRVDLTQKYRKPFSKL